MSSKATDHSEKSKRHNVADEKEPEPGTKRIKLSSSEIKQMKREDNVGKWQEQDSYIDHQDTQMGRLKLALIEKFCRKIKLKFLTPHKLLLLIEQVNLSEVQSFLDDFTEEQLETLVQPMNDNIYTLNQNPDLPSTTYERIATLEWDWLLEESLGVIGKVLLQLTKKNVPNYEKMYRPVLVCGTHSTTDKSPGVFSCPDGVAIDPATGYIYICDRSNRVQVFDSSFYFLFQFNDHVNFPVGICILQDRVYITQWENHCLNVYNTDGKFLESVGTLGDHEMEFNRPRGVVISTDRHRIYVSERDNHRLQCFRFDLTFHSFVPNIPSPIDVRLTADEIVVLVGGGDVCLMFYNYEHEYIQSLIQFRESEKIWAPISLSIDAVGNFLISDSTFHCVKVFSCEGEKICEIGGRGQSKGSLISPRGVLVHRGARLLIPSSNTNYALQLF